MRLVALVLLGLSASAASTAAQTKEPELGVLFHQALLACTSPADGALDMWSACAGVRFGAIEPYLEAASACIDTRSEKDCAEAKKLGRMARDVLKSLSKR